MFNLLRVKLLVFALVLSAPLSASGNGGFTNVGIIPSNIWYSKLPVYADEEVLIYTALFNNSEYVFRGVIGFYDKEKLISKETFVLKASDYLKQISTVWVPSVGPHIITANVLSAEASLDGIDYSPVILDNTLAGEQSINVDVSPDKDEIAKLKQKINDLTLAGVKGTVLVTATKVIDSSGNSLKSVAQLIDTATEETADMIERFALSKAVGIKSRIDGQTKIVSTKDRQVLSSVDLEASADDLRQEGSGWHNTQVASIGFFNMTWDYVKYVFYYVVALIFGNKWGIYTLSALTAILTFRWMLARRRLD